MREFIERFSYRFKLWQNERYGDRWGADPTAPRNPLRIMAVLCVVFLIVDATEPFFFHHVPGRARFRSHPCCSAVPRPLLVTIQVGMACSGGLVRLLLRSLLDLTGHRVLAVSAARSHGAVPDCVRVV